MEVQDEAQEAVRRLTQSGFYDPEEIALIVAESVPCGDEVLDPNWLRNVVEEAASRKQTDEETWPAVTDCDRLDAVFAHLQVSGVLTLEDVGHPEDARESVKEAYEDAGGAESGYGGYCYYGDLDIKYALKVDELSLAFGTFAHGNAEASEVAERVKAAFEEAGFVAEWYDTVPKGLVLKPFRWQRRMPR